MSARLAAGFAGLVGVGTWLVVSCDYCGTVPEPVPPVSACRRPVTVSVSEGTVPVFSWTPDCLSGRLIVYQGGPEQEYWGTETLGLNIYRSPIVYGVHPPGSVESQVPQPLTPGATYTVAVYYWPSSHPDSLDKGFVLIGKREFTP